MRVDSFFICDGLDGREEIFDAGIFQYESLDTGSDEFQDLFFRLGGSAFACSDTFWVKLQG